MDDEDLKSASDALARDDKPAYRVAAKKSNRSKKPLIIALAVIVVVAIGGFALKKFLFKSDKPTPASSSNQTPQSAAPTNKDDVPDAELTETYESTALSVSFKYPKTWKVSEADKGVRIDSPAFNFPSAGQGNVDGLFRIYIRQGARDKDGVYIGDGLAIKPSEKLTYTDPALGQRTDTLLSSFGSNSTDIFTFFLIAGNFQLQKGDTLGPDYGKEPDTYIIAGGYTIPTATDDLGMTSVETDYYATTNAYKQAHAIIASLQLH